ncbi:MAG: methionine biosynthesis protein MetW [Candidatus Omnitrophica bacterium]|nr:methionine biosynthesis protein MetW [Candidatus Omnitrophota bacterium]
MRPDHRIILEWIKPGATVLDLGCGSGDLLYLLIKEKEARGHGIDISNEEIYKCVAKGLNVLHGDIENGLADYKDQSFDYVILNQSMQQILHVDRVLQDALRVGKKVVVGFPNFTYYRSRLQILFRGKTPVNASLPYQWYETPNLHFLSILDFIDYCRTKNVAIEEKSFLGTAQRLQFFPNLFAQTGIFLISKAK